MGLTTEDWNEKARAAGIGTRLRPDLVDGATAERDAKTFARAGQDKLDFAMARY